jgi:hypothetical protein
LKFFNKKTVAALVLCVISASTPAKTPPPVVVPNTGVKFCVVPVKDEDSNLVYLNPSLIVRIFGFRGKPTFVTLRGDYVSLPSGDLVVAVNKFMADVEALCK